MIYPHWGLAISRHNEIRDLTTDWMSEICTDVEKEPLLQPLSGEHILPWSANEDDVRLDIRAKGL